MIVKLEGLGRVYGREYAPDTGEQPGKPHCMNQGAYLHHCFEYFWLSSLGGSNPSQAPLMVAGAFAPSFEIFFFSSNL